MSKSNDVSSPKNATCHMCAFLRQVHDDVSCKIGLPKLTILKVGIQEMFALREMDNIISWVYDAVHALWSFNTDKFCDSRTMFYSKYEGPWAGTWVNYWIFIGVDLKTRFLYTPRLSDQGSTCIKNTRLFVFTIFSSVIGSVCYPDFQSVFLVAPPDARASYYVRLPLPSLLLLPLHPFSHCSFWTSLS